MLEKGFVHIYTGNGKGKTTAALGLAVRAAGAGLRVFILQFMKGMPYSEHRFFEEHDAVKIEQYGSTDFYHTGKDRDRHMAFIQEGMRRAKEVLLSGEFSLVILDEVVTAVQMGLLDEKEVVDLIRKRPAGTELVLTGRGATATLLEYADLVTEMKEVRHYYTKGIVARKGIEF